MKIALLGWGSLLWDHRPAFDATIGPWSPCGPLLPVEFCRISTTRKGALVLVIDRALGAGVQVFYTLSVRDDPADALADLRAREGTSMQQIGFVDLLAGEQRGRDPEAVATITTWAQHMNIPFAAWTDLASNFKSKTGKPFTHEAALAHLKSLKKAGRREAVRYIVKAPPQVDTPFRQWLATVPWFQDQLELFKDEL